MKKECERPPHLLAALTSIIFTFFFRKQPITVSALDAANLMEFGISRLVLLMSICVVASVIRFSLFNLPDKAKKDEFRRREWAIVAGTVDIGRGTETEGDSHKLEENASVSAEEGGRHVSAFDEEQNQDERMVDERVKENKETDEFNKRVEEFILKFHRQIKSEDLGIASASYRKCKMS